MSTLQDFHDKFTGLEDYRAKRPLFDKLPDDDLVEMLRQHYASDMPPDEFNRAVGYVPPPREKPVVTQPAGMRPDTREIGDIAIDTVRNVGAGVLKIGPTALKGAADVANMITGDRYDFGVSQTMKDGMEAIDNTVASKRFNEQQKGFKALMADESKSLGDMFGYMMDNPSIMVDNIITTTGGMLLPAGVAKAANAVGTKALGVGVAMAPKITTAATIGTSALQNAAETFMALKDQPMEKRREGAIFAAGISMLTSIALGGGAKGKAAEKMADDLKAGRIGLDAVKNFLLSVGKGGVQGAGEKAGSIGGEFVGGKEVTPNDAAKRVASAAVSGAAGAGLGHLATGLDGEIQQRRAAEKARSAAPSEAPAAAGRRADPAAESAARASDAPANPAAQGRAPAAAQTTPQRQPAVPKSAAAEAKRESRASFEERAKAPPADGASRAAEKGAPQAEAGAGRQRRSGERAAKNIDTDALLATVEASRTPAGNIIVSGENAIKVVRAIAPDARILRRRDGAVAVSKRYSDSVQQGIDGAKRRTRVATEIPAGLLAGVQATRMRNGNVLITGENAAEAVKAIAPDAPVLQRKDGAVAVSRHYSDSVLRGIDDARLRINGDELDDLTGFYVSPAP